MLRYYEYHDRRNPLQLGAPEVTAFLNALATERHVAASTQNQALAALLFLYRDVLGQDLPWLNPTKAKARVSTAANRGEFVTNKKKGRDRRVKLDSFSTWRIKQRNRGLDAEDAEL